MSTRITGKKVVGILPGVDPSIRGVAETYCFADDAQLREISDPEEIDDDFASVVIQQPNFLGDIESLEDWEKVIHERKALMIVSADPVFAAMVEPPGSFNADIVVGEGQPLGINTRFGGSYFGILTCKSEYVRQLPGRLYAETVDTQGRRGFVMTLMTREQFSKRAGATSNLTTSIALNALAAAVYLAAMGEYGLKHVAELSYERAHYAADRISRLPGFALIKRRDFFRQFVIKCPIPPRELNEILLKAGIIGGLDVSKQPGENAMLFCVTEMNPRGQIDKLVEMLEKVKL